MADQHEPNDNQNENQMPDAIMKLLNRLISSEIHSVIRRDTRRNTISMGVQPLQNADYTPTNNDPPENEVVITDTEIYIKYSYPLSKSHIHKHITKNPNGFTRKELYEQIAAHYHTIYAEEDAAVGPTSNIPGMFNRDTSNGPHGIWGHHIGDLILTDIAMGDNDVYELGISS